jgi:hypothetical protein
VKKGLASVAMDKAHVPAVVIRKYGLRPMVFGYLLDFGNDQIQGFVPGDGLEKAFTLGAFAL